MLKNVYNLRVLFSLRFKINIVLHLCINIKDFEIKKTYKGHKYVKKEIGTTNKEIGG